MDREQAEQQEFEEEVRTVARALWPSASFGGVENIRNVEHDGIFPAFDTIHSIIGPGGMIVLQRDGS